MGKESKEEQKERGQNQKNNKIRTKHLSASKNVLSLQFEQGAEKKVHCYTTVSL